uniref:Peptidoglycan binding-like domain-containing protein n=1 Tax=Gopherus agassizii TaxID=38772 RepID=A0A452GNR0_9SAUR
EKGIRTHPESVSFYFQNYLDRFFPSIHKADSRTLEDKIKEMQKFFHLTVTGKFNSETEEMMDQPRCGIPDVLDYSTFPGNPRWRKNLLTYRLVIFYFLCILFSFNDAILFHTLN